jgi:F0F1-type ATP synthase assembly protein I
MSKQKEKNKLKAYAKYSNMGFQMVTIIGLGVFGGVKLDEFISWKFPIFTIILALLSVSLAIYISIKDLLK